MDTTSTTTIILNEEVENNAGEKVVPQEVVDDAVYNFFETGRFEIS